MAKSKNQVLLRSVILVRDGKRVSPPIGKALALSEEELEGLKEGVHYRNAVNEDQEADDAELVALSNSPHVGGAKTNAKGAGKTTGMTDGMDGTTTTEGEAGQDSDSNKAGKTAVPTGKAAGATKPAADDDL